MKIPKTLRRKGKDIYTYQHNFIHIKDNDFFYYKIHSVERYNEGDPSKNNLSMRIVDLGLRNFFLYRDFKS